MMIYKIIVGVTPDDKQYKSLCAIKDIFEGYGCNVKMQRNIRTDEAETAGDEYDLIVYALCRSTHNPIGPMDFRGDEATSAWSHSTLEAFSKAVFGEISFEGKSSVDL